MPPPRNPATRTSQRRNSLQDDTPARTRAGRGGKPGPSKPETPEVMPPRASPSKLSPTTTRKTTRSASNISGRSFEAAPEAYASYEEPLLMIFGLSPAFLDGLKKHHGKLPKERKSLVLSLPQQASSQEEEDDSESEEESDDESDVEAPIVAHAAPRGRGRGGRGARGGRGRGGRARGRGRGGRPRGSLSRAASPVRARIARNAATMVPLEEEDDDEVSANQRSRSYGAKPSLTTLPNAEPVGETVNSEDENENAIAEDDSEAEDYAMQDLQKGSDTSGSSPPPEYHESTSGGSINSQPAPEPDPGPSAKALKPLPVPKISLPKRLAAQSVRNSPSVPAESAVPKLLRPEDDVLSETDLPEPWIEDLPPPIEAECEDRADYLLQKRFKPMVDVQDVIASLTKYSISQRSTDSLYALAENTQVILKAWQDQYLMLDARTAPHMNPAKKACNGGRIPLAGDVFEAMKEAELYSYTYDPKKIPETQDPWAQRPGAEKSGGRELRTRRNRDMLDSAPVSEEDDDDDNDGRLSKRQRKATRKFDGSDAGTGTGNNTPKKHSGWGGARKKGVSRFIKTASVTPEPEGRPAKRARTAATNLLHQRIQEMREASLVPSSGDEDSSVVDVDDYSDSNAKRGRPAGSKNVARRSDFGVKKGPRKKTSEVGTPVPSAHGPSAPPPALQSMSAGQGQFSLDPQPLSEQPLSAPNTAETVFQVTPQPTVLHSAAVSLPDLPDPADAFMHTAPLSQYTTNYMDDSIPMGGSRRKPRVKSEKRSQSMTIWWAERKARKKEQDEKNGIPTRSPLSRPGSSNGKRGRASTGSSAAGPSSTMQEPHRRASLQYPEQQQQQHHHYVHPDPYNMHHQHQHPPYTATSPMYMYASAPAQHPLMMQYSPLAALPSGTYAFSAPPPLGPQYSGARALAPAPMQGPAYPSPYGPQSPVGSRPRSSGRNGPPPLAPAPPTHYSPYPPVPIARDMPFKVMIPGPPPGEARDRSG